jgi:hypothetical protein
MLSIRENYIDCTFHSPILIRNNCIWRSTIHAFQPSLKQPYKISLYSSLILMLHQKVLTNHSDSLPQKGANDISYLLIKYVVSNVTTSPKSSYAILLHASAKNTFFQSTIIIKIHGDVETIINCLHSNEIITKCSSSSCAKPKMSFLGNKITTIFFSKCKILIPPYFDS